MKHWSIGMRDSFFASLYNIAAKDKDVILITSDTGAICHDLFKRKLPKQNINVGIAEQNMVGLAAGMALSGKIVYVYAIVPFSTMRCYEQIRVDLCCMDLPVTVVGIGAGFDYSTLGPTHHGTEDIGLMRLLPNMRIYSPSDSLLADLLAEECYKIPGPKYVRLDREGLPLLYKNSKKPNISDGFSLLKEGRDLYIISTGRMSREALLVAQQLGRHSISAGVIDLFRIKPIAEEKIMSIINKAGHLVTLEEHFVTGGIGSMIAEILARRKNTQRLKIFGIPDEFCRKYGSRDYLRRLNKIDAGSVTAGILKWFRE
jgi:transketolase